MKILATLTLALATLTLPAQTPASQHEPGAMPSSMPSAMPGSMPAKPPVPPSHSVTIIFNGTTKVLTLDELLKLPQVTVHVHNAHRNTDEDYTGPLVSDVLALAGLAPTHENEKVILHSTVTASATDGYFVVYSAAEMEPAFSTGKVIIADSKAGAPDTEGGLIQLINTVDAKPARWIHGLTTLTITTQPGKK